jgi:hypothetical protein
MVTIIVGSSPEKTWVVHERLLTRTSRFAATALRWGGKEQQERTLRLPEEDPDVFETFVRFIYTSSVDVFSISHKIRLYVLADRMQADSLRQKLFSGLSTWLLFADADLEYVLANTIPGDALRHVCLDRLSRDILRTPTAIKLEFGTVLCDKYAGEILAKMMGKYDAIIRRPAENPAKDASSPGTPVEKAQPSSSIPLKTADGNPVPGLFNFSSRHSIPLQTASTNATPQTNVTSSTTTGQSVPSFTFFSSRAQQPGTSSTSQNGNISTTTTLPVPAPAAANADPSPGSGNNAS